MVRTSLDMGYEVEFKSAFRELACSWDVKCLGLECWRSREVEPLTREPQRPEHGEDTEGCANSKAK